MRSFFTILLTAVFMTAQYAKQVSYLECRLTNYLSRPGQECDCEKLLQDNKPGDPSSLPLHRGHIHIDPWYFPPECITADCKADSILPAYNSQSDPLLHQGIFNAIEHPPPLS